MAVKPDDRRVQRTRALLRDALLDLMAEKGYEAVTVQDIIDRANVGRSTFYAHFLDKQALLQSGLDELHKFLAQHVMAVAHSGTSRRGLGFSLAMFQHAQGNHRLYLVLAGNQSGVFVHQQMHRMFADLVHRELAAQVPSGASLPVPLEVVVQYTVSAFQGLLTWWLDQKMDCSAEEMDRRFRTLTWPGITAALKLPPAAT